MNKLDQLSESRLLSLAMVLQGIKNDVQVFDTNTADPWIPWPWP